MPIDDAGACGQPQQVTDGFSVQHPIVFDAAGYLYNTQFDQGGLRRLASTDAIEPRDEGPLAGTAITVEPPGDPLNFLYWTNKTQAGANLYRLQLGSYLSCPTSSSLVPCGREYRYLHHPPSDLEIIATYSTY